MTRLIKLSRNLLLVIALFFFLCSSVEALAQKAEQPIQKPGVEQPIANPPTVEQPIEKPGVEQPIANPPIDALPEGSYKSTCKNARIEGEYLRADCEKKNEGWKDTKIKYKKCSGDIRNNNGTLNCQ